MSTADRPPDVPTATVVAVSRGTVTVVCPYCGQRHQHSTRDARGAESVEWRAPGCGLVLGEIARLTGYTFTLHPRPARAAASTTE